MTLQNTDDFLVNRSGVNYSQDALNLTMKLQDTDLMLVNRGGTNYKITGAEVKDSLIKPYKAGDFIGGPSTFSYNYLTGYTVGWRTALSSFSGGTTYPPIEIFSSLNSGQTWEAQLGYGGGTVDYPTSQTPTSTGLVNPPYNGLVYLTSDGFYFPVSNLNFGQWVDSGSYFYQPTTGVGGITQPRNVAIGMTYPSGTSGGPVYTSQGFAQNYATGVAISGQTARSGSGFAASTTRFQSLNVGSYQDINTAIGGTNQLGATWVQYLPTLDKWIANPTYTAFRVSSNDGVSWSSASIPATADATIGAVANSNRILTFDTGGNVFYSTNGGTSFTAGTTPPKPPGVNTSVLRIAFVVNNVFYVFTASAETGTGRKLTYLCRTTNGTNWTYTDVTGEWSGAGFDVNGMTNRAIKSSSMVTDKYVFIGCQALPPSGLAGAVGEQGFRAYPLSYFT